MQNILFNFLQLSAQTFDDSSNGLFTPDDFLNKLIPNFWSFLVQLLAFIILIVVVIFLAYKPVKKIIKKRADYVEGNIKESKEKNIEADKNVEQAKANVTESKKTAAGIVNKAQTDALVVQQSIIDEGKKKADQEIAQARVQIAYEQEKAKSEVRQEIVDVALDASKKILEREVNDKDNEKLVHNFIDEVKNEKKEGN